MKKRSALLAEWWLVDSSDKSDSSGKLWRFILFQTNQIIKQKVGLPVVVGTMTPMRRHCYVLVFMVLHQTMFPQYICVFCLFLSQYIYSCNMKCRLRAVSALWIRQAETVLKTPDCRWLCGIAIYFGPVYHVYICRSEWTLSSYKREKPSAKT